jgi:P4 family phage/plasmid primase-like protien
MHRAAIGQAAEEGGGAVNTAEVTQRSGGIAAHRRALTTEYAKNGWVLVPIPAGVKAPAAKGWNDRARCINTPEAAGRITANVGIAHSYSGTCSVDFDALDKASVWLAEQGIDAQELLSAPDAVRISSGRPNRAKLLYRLATPLPSLKLVPYTDANGKEFKALEFRCATANDKTTQCVLPPSIHPDTGKPYVWEYGDDLIGDWRFLPEIPPALLALWKKQLAPASPTSTSLVGIVGDAPDLDSIRALLAQHNPDSGYDDWLKVGMALHFETGGSADGFDLWNEFSAKGSKYKGAADLETHWRSFHSYGDRLITLASLRVEKADADGFDIVAAGSEADPGKAVAVGTVPKGFHLCTDQANARRISLWFGQRMISASGRFYAWSGRHWAHDEGEAHRCAARLSAIVKAEAEAERKKLNKAAAAFSPEQLQAAAEHPRKSALAKTEEGAKLIELQAKVTALDAWSVRCEMKAVQDAALGLLRKLLTVDQSALDRDPWVLNCQNGTVDLRTGELHPHNPKDYITKLVPLDYDPTAAAPRFEKFVLELMGGDAPRAKFLQRWFGYCATGDVREQKLVVHIGAGANGKGTLQNTVAAVLGDYSGTAAPGLLASTGGGDRHPTEIADLFGRRLVTAHENDEAAVLREGFVKQATGGDTLKARWMRADFFEFRPTHKLQLLTNHKPQVKGQDFGIWRRILLVPYPVRFGTEAEIAEGRATKLRDDGLAEALQGELPGVLRWVVDGAKEWCRTGLNPPDSVLAAGHEYQSEQDRVAQFVNECCELAEREWTAFAVLYFAYKTWCSDSGYAPLGKGKFVNELERVVPFFRKETKKVSESSKRKSVVGALGVKIPQDESLWEVAS